MNPFLAQIVMFAGNFAPRGWALCNGQLLPIASNQALFSLLGTIYGGDGRTTFALPDLRGRSPIHAGTGPGLSTIRLGQRGGIEEITLTLANLPNHNHAGGSLQVSSAAADDDVPSSNVSIGAAEIYVAADPTVNLQTGSLTIGNTGGGRAFNSRNPFLGINYIIALQGTFPSRS